MSIKQLTTAGDDDTGFLAQAVKASFKAVTGHSVNVAIVQGSHRLEALVELRTIVPSLDIYDLMKFRAHMAKNDLVEPNGLIELLPKQMQLRFRINS